MSKAARIHQQHRPVAPVPRPRAPRLSTRALVLSICGAAAVVVALVLMVVLSSGSSSATGPAVAFPDVATLVAPLDGVPQSGATLGRSSAKLTVEVYLDAQCPYCREWETRTLPVLASGLVKRGSVKIESRGLAFVGPDSERGLRALIAAAAQNRLFQAELVLYANQGAENSGWLSNSFVDSLIASLPRVDSARFHRDMGSAATTAEIARVVASAKADGVKGTPTLVLRGPAGQKLAQFQPTSFEPSGTLPQVEKALASLGA